MSQLLLADRKLNLVGLVGFSALVGAVLVAHANPATGYELSLYTATPVAVWAGIGVAFACSLVLTFATRSDTYRRLGVVLGGLTSATVVALPVLRGYVFHGIHDSLTHLGWARSLTEGSTVPLEMLYPGVHTVGTFISGVAGLSLSQSMLLIPLIFVVAFYAFVPLVVGELVDAELAAPVGAFSAYLLVPTHLIANTVHVHPSSQAILFASIGLFLLVVYLRTSDGGRYGGVLSPTGGALLLVVFAAILYHPMQALNVVLVLGAVSAVRFLAGRIDRVRWTDHRTVYSVAALSLVAYVAWVLKQPVALNVAERATTSVLEFVTGSETEAGSTVATTTSSLRAISESLPVFYSKLFLVSTVFVVLTVVVVLLALADRFDRSVTHVDTTETIRYLGVALLGMFGVFCVYFFGDVAAHYFREAGFMLMVGTVLSAVGIAYWTERASETGGRAVARTALVGAFAVMLVLSTLIVFNSPYIHRANQHVTDARVDGYETAFATTNESSVMGSVRQEPERYYEALSGDMDPGTRLDTSVNSSQLSRLGTVHEGDWYLMIHSNTYARELTAYEGLRFDRRDFRSVRRQTDVHRVHANSDTELYYVR